MKTIHVLGLTLWRGGALLVLAYLAFWSMRSVLSITDSQLEFAVAVGLAGLLLVLVSIVMERVGDAKADRERLSDNGL